MTRRIPLPEVPGLLTPAAVSATVDAIAAVQEPDGNLPWLAGHRTDPWNLVEAAMALSVGGRVTEAERAYTWLADRQRPDGAWHAGYRGDTIVDPTLDTNFTGYVATGSWHHFLVTGDRGFLATMWPTVHAAVEFVVRHQRPSGAIDWCSDPTHPDPGALVAGSSSLHLSLRAAVAIAEHLGHERPDWELAIEALGRAVAHRPEAFLDKERWSMDWYYPILCGVLRGPDAHTRVADGWGRFVVEGRGVRCVSDRPWVTAAETCEAVLALDAIGADADARRLFSWIQFLRTDDGGYWTGANFEGERFAEDGTLFPAEQPTWNLAAVVLAANALGGTGPAAGLFRGEMLPPTRLAEEPEGTRRF